MKELILSKESTENEIKTYFQKVLELKQSNDEFPVNLEEVWPLVYGKKSDAVEALRKDFIEHVDFQSLRQNPQRGSASPIDYNLSVSCLEYFIVRKVRPIFDVYRKVFHRAAEQKPLSTLELLELTIKGMRENHQELQEVKRDVLELKAKTVTRPDYFTIVGYGTLKHVSINIRQASMLGRKATKLCQERGLMMDKIPDPRFGEVKMYPGEVLSEVFSEPINY